MNQLHDTGGMVREDRWPRLPGSYHGSGCTLASAVAAHSRTDATCRGRRRRAGLHLARAQQCLQPRRWAGYPEPVFPALMMRGLYAITPDLADTALLTAKVETALKAGVAMLQYRNKDLAKDKRLLQAKELRRARPRLWSALHRERRSRHRARRRCERCPPGQG